MQIGTKTVCAFLLLAASAHATTYYFSGTFNGNVYNGSGYTSSGPATLSGTFTVDSTGLSVSGFSIDFSQANLPFPLLDSNASNHTLVDGVTGYVYNVFGPYNWEFEEYIGLSSHWVAVTLDFNPVTGAMVAGQDSLGQAPTSGGNWSYLGFFSSGSAEALPEPTTLSLVGSLLIITGILKRNSTRVLSSAARGNRRSGPLST